MKRFTNILFIFLLLNCIFLLSASAQYKWDQVRIGGSGAVTSIKGHPRVANLYFVTTDVGTPYRWNASSQKWEHMMLFNKIPATYWNWGVNQQCGDIAIDPNDNTGNILYATVQNGKGTVAGGGTTVGTVMKSTDRGESWTDLNLPVIVEPNSRQGYTSRLLVDPANSNVVWVTTDQNGTYKSNNAGIAWKKVTTGIPDKTLNSSNGVIVRTRFILFDVSKGTAQNEEGQTVSKNIYLGSNDGIYLSQDGGLSFSLMPGSPMDTRRATIHSDGTLYVVTYNKRGVFKFVDNVWYNITPETGKDYAGVAVNPHNSKEIVTSATGTWNKDAVFTSKNGGNVGSWIKIKSTKDNTEAPHSKKDGLNDFGNVGHDTNGFLWDLHIPNMVWLTDASDVIHTTNIWQDPVPWKIRVLGIEEVVVTGPLSAPPFGKNLLLSATADIGGAEHGELDQSPVRTMSGSGLDHLITMGINSQDITYQYSNPDFLVRIGSDSWDQQQLTYSRSGYSLNGGSTWTMFPTSPGLRGRAAIAASGKRIVWLTQIDGPGKIGSVYYTDDYGVTWRPSSGAPKGILPFGGQWDVYAGANHLVADKVDPNLFYIWDRGKFYVSKDGGSSFVETASGLPNNGNNPNNNSSYPTITNLATTPGKAGDIWLAANMEPWDATGLYHSKDTGKTWQKIPNFRPKWVATAMSDTTSNAHPVIYATSSAKEFNGISYGVFRSDDLGNTWNLISERLPGVASNLAADNKGRVFAGINGNGLWYAAPSGGPVESVVIQNMQSDTVTATKQLQLKAVIIPQYPTNPAVTWSSSDTAIAQIDQTGLLTAQQAGETIITLISIDGNKSDTRKIVVTPEIKAENIIVDSILYATLNMTKKLQATVTPDSTTYKNLIWTIDDNTIAKLDSNGSVTGIKQGMANIIIKTPDGSISKAVKLIVNTTVLAINAGSERTGYEFNKKTAGQFVPEGPNGDNYLWKAGNAWANAPATRSINLTKVENPAPMTVYQSSRFGYRNVTPLRYYFRNLIPRANYVLRLHFAEIDPNMKIGKRVFTVKSNNSPDSLVNLDIMKEAGGVYIAIARTMNIAADANGLITVFFYPAGNNTTDPNNEITMLINGLELSLVPLQSISINAKKDTLIVNDTDTLKAIANPSNATNPNVIWKSSDVNIATIHSDGTIRGISTGLVTFTATSAEGGFIATKQITVTNLNVSGISVSTPKDTLSVGEIVQLTHTITPANATNRKVTWSSSDTAIATVDSLGKVNTKAAGSVAITVVSDDGGFSAVTNLFITNVLVTDIILGPQNEKLGVRDTLRLTKNILPANATMKNLIWTTSDSSKAVVDNDGIVRAVSEGIVTITATSMDEGAFSKSIDITIVPIGQCGLIENNGFESDFVNWEKTANPDFIKISKTVVHSGYKSAAFLANAEGSTLVKKDVIDVVPGSTLTVSAWYKVDSSYNQWGGKEWPWWAGNGFFFNDSTGKALAYTKQYDIHTLPNVRNGFVEYKTTIVVPNSAAVMGFWITKVGPGVLYIDDYCIKVQVDSITTDAENISIREGEQKRINTNIWPVNATDKQVVWRSLNPSVAVVDSSGTITGVAQGATSIIVTALNGAAAPNASGNTIRTSNTGGAGLTASAKNGLELLAVSSFDLGTPVSDTISVLVTSAVLPVELVKFNVEKENNTVKLTWTTVSEKNNKEFVVYHSEDGKQYRVLLSQKSKNSNGGNYVAYHKSPVNGINYYKLSQVDIDGKSKELETKSIVFDLGKLIVQLYPNPVKNIAYLHINSSQETTLHINVYNLSGANVLSKKLNVKKGTNNTSIIMNNLQKGIYFVNVQDAKSETREVIKILLD